MLGGVADGFARAKAGAAGGGRRPAVPRTGDVDLGDGDDGSLDDGARHDGLWRRGWIARITPAPQDILKRRLAAGEISREQYEQLQQAIRA